MHGACEENPLAPLIGRLGLPLYRTSEDNSVLYDHDLERYRVISFGVFFFQFFSFLLSLDYSILMCRAKVISIILESHTYSYLVRLISFVNNELICSGRKGIHPIYELDPF